MTFTVSGFSPFVFTSEATGEELVIIDDGNGYIINADNKYLTGVTPESKLSRVGDR